MRTSTQTVIIILISISIPVLVAFLFLFTNDPGATSSWISTLPRFHAIINSVTSITLIVGLYFVKKGNTTRHKQFMLSSFFLGCIFLVSYVIYHSNVPSTSYGGEGVMKTVYYVILLSHILLAIIAVPLVLFALYYALSNNLGKHRKIVKYAWPIWLYVSVSGVLVYLMISPYY